MEFPKYSQGMTQFLWLALAAGAATLLAQLAAFALWVRPVGTTALWFPGGVAIALLATHHRQAWPALLLGVAVGGALAFRLRDGAMRDALIGYLGLVMLLGGVALLLRLPVLRGRLFETMRDLLRFYLYAVVGFALAGTAWTIFIILSIKHQLEHFVSFWLLAAPCFAAAMVLVAPLLAEMPAFMRADAGARRRLLADAVPACLLSLLIICVLWAVLPDTINRLPPLVFATVPLLVMCAFRLQSFGLSLVLLVSLLPSFVIAIRMDLPNLDDIGLVNTQILQWSTIAIGFLVHALAIVARSHRTAEERLERAAALAINRQEEERAAVSRDLHDSIGQRIALAAFTLGNLPPQAPGASAGPIEGVRTSLIALLDEVRSMSRNLHPSSVAHAGLHASLEALAVEIAGQWDGQVVTEILPVRAQLPDEVALNLFRITQEAVRNAIEHGRAHTLRIALGENASGGVALEVEDDGSGFEVDSPAGEGLGLLSMRERSRQIGAGIEIRSGTSGGTLVCVTLAPAA